MMTALRDSRTRPVSSMLMTLTASSSPSFTMSVTSRTRNGASSLMCTRPSVPGMISTKAP